MGYTTDRRVLTDSIEITKTEEKIFAYILDYCDTLDVQVTPRVAGGWVRDKIMRDESYDLDIALDKISGHQFALGMSKFYEHKLSAVGLIKSNPDKSKHLETAVIKIEGRFVDFVCLRTEKYAHTRIPEVMIGTVREDAFRRDITINALFYNLKTKEIEDYTGMGLHDLQKGIIRTPIDPLQTFLDDPLRILRAFRFAAKYDFKICEDIYRSLANENLEKNLHSKVSSERIGAEVIKIINSNNGDKTLIEFIQHDLYKHIFKPVIEVDIDYRDAAKFVEILANNKKELGYTGGSNLGILNLYTVLIFFGNKTFKQKKTEFVNVILVKESLKYSNMLSKTVFEVESNLNYIFTNNIFKERNIDEKILVQMAKHMGEMGETSLILALSYVQLQTCDLDTGFLKLVYKSIKSKGYFKVYRIRPIVNGKDIKECLQVENSTIKHIIDEGIIYQVLNPNAEKSEIIKYLMTIFSK